MTLDLIIEAVTGIVKLLAAGLLMWAFTGFIMETIEKQYGHHDDRTVRAWEAPNETNEHYTTTEGGGEVIGIGLMAAFPIVMFIIYADAVGHPIF